MGSVIHLILGSIVFICICDVLYALNISPSDVRCLVWRGLFLHSFNCCSSTLSTCSSPGAGLRSTAAPARPAPAARLVLVFLHQLLQHAQHLQLAWSWSSFNSCSSTPSTSGLLCPGLPSTAGPARPAPPARLVRHQLPK